MPRTAPPPGPLTRSAAAAACEPTAGKRRSGSGEEEVREWEGNDGTPFQLVSHDGERAVCVAPPRRPPLPASAAPRAEVAGRPSSDWGAGAAWWPRAGGEPAPVRAIFCRLSSFERRRPPLPPIPAPDTPPSFPTPLHQHTGHRTQEDAPRLCRRHQRRHSRPLRGGRNRAAAPRARARVRAPPRPRPLPGRQRGRWLWGVDAAGGGDGGGGDGGHHRSPAPARRRPDRRARRRRCARLRRLRGRHLCGAGRL